ncbi:hypothetical protein [Thermospira aquatica]|uniref:Uncharacterized protein n=1 Tax=Thermospira aquatica TaxID=2828656 RepID=A0AAX3BE35_9SPIR|nr:hypothetical protein [Thermospira aquatica]URA10491.1 hypothetical protein KDW03_01430 [Thermospira aquatica]
MNGKRDESYESVVWTNSWLQIRKKELALPLEIRTIALSFSFPESWQPWKPTIEDALTRELFSFQRIVDNKIPQAQVVIELLPLRSQMIPPEKKIYEIRGTFSLFIGDHLFRSNVVIFDRVFAYTNVNEDTVYNHLILRWAQYAAENIHYGWSVSQDFSSIPVLGGSNETPVSYPRTQ